MKSRNNRLDALLLILAALVILLSVYLDFPKTGIGILCTLIGIGLTHVSSKYLNKQKLKHQLSLIALDKKLEAHQQAYAIWWKIIANVYNREKIGRIVEEAQDWWQNNCLYLMPESRISFRQCFLFALNHADEIKTISNKDDLNRISNENWIIINKPGRILVEEIELPAFDDEYPLQDKEKVN